MKITMNLRDCDAAQALTLVGRFLADYPDNHRAFRPQRHGVICRMGDGHLFFVYGDARHVRVKQIPEGR